MAPARRPLAILLRFPRSTPSLHLLGLTGPHPIFAATHRMRPHATLAMAIDMCGRCSEAVGRHAVTPASPISYVRGAVASVYRRASSILPNDED
jgi:hypothetical protein